MEVANNKIPSKIVDTVELICTHCKQIAYQEVITATAVENHYVYKKLVTGAFTQECDEQGNVSGAVMPFCNCRGAV